MSKVYATSSIKADKKVELTKDMMEKYNIRPNSRDEHISEEGITAFRNKLLALLQLGDFEVTTNINVDVANQTICRLHKSTANVSLGDSTTILFYLHSSDEGVQHGAISYWLKHYLGEISNEIKEKQASIAEHLKGEAIRYANQISMLENARLMLQAARKQADEKQEKLITANAAKN